MPDATRPYRSTRRAAAAAQTRHAIANAATELFGTLGYTATTMRAVADRAGVGERTVFDAFSGKADLFRYALDVATAGADQEAAVPWVERTQWRRSRELADPHEALAEHIRLTVDLMEQAGDLLMACLAAGSEPELQPETGLLGGHDVHLALTSELHGRGQVRPGLDATTAADVLYAVCSPHVHQLLRRDRRWEVSRYRTWLTDTADRELLRAVPDRSR